MTIGARRVRVRLTVMAFTAGLILSTASTCRADGTTEQFERSLLTEAQFVAALMPTELETTGTELLAITYAAGEMFWEHSICVTSFDGLSLADARVEL